MAGRTRGKELARAVLRWPGVGPAVGRAVGRLGLATGRAAPVLDSVYRRLPASAGLPYGATTETQHAALLAYYGRLENYLAHAEYRPRISIVVPTYKPVYQYLHEMLGSIALQVYPNWQLCIVDDASGDPEVTRILAGFAAAHPGKVAYATRAENGHIAATSNDALALADGDYVALLDHDDRLYPHALAEVVLGLNAHRAADGRYPLVVYTDERMIDEDGAPIGEVWLKPDWMPLLHLTSNYTNHLTVYSRELLAELGGFRTGFDGSQDHDLMLRATEATDAAGLPVVHLPTIAYQWRSHPGSVAKDPGVKSYSVEPAMRAVAQACERRERPAQGVARAGDRGQPDRFRAAGSAAEGSRVGARRCIRPRRVRALDLRLRQPRDLPCDRHFHRTPGGDSATGARRHRRRLSGGDECFRATRPRRLGRCHGRVGAIARGGSRRRPPARRGRQGGLGRADRDGLAGHGPSDGRDASHRGGVPGLASKHPRSPCTGFGGPDGRRASGAGSGRIPRGSGVHLLPLRHRPLSALAGSGLLIGVHPIRRIRPGRRGRSGGR